MRVCDRSISKSLPLTEPRSDRACERCHLHSRTFPIAFYPMVGKGNVLKPVPTPAQKIISITNRSDWLIAWAVSAIAVLLCLFPAHRRTLWCDEYLTMATFERSIASMTTERLEAGHSPVYFLYARLAGPIGSPTWQLRLTSMIMAAANILALTGLLRALNLRHLLPVVWVISVFHPYWILLGSLVRYMMPLVALATLTMWLTVRFAQRSTLGRGLALGAVASLLGWIHMSASLVTISCLFYLTRESRVQNGKWNLGSVLRMTCPILIAILLTLPLVILIRNHRPLAFDGFSPGGVLDDLLEVAFGSPRYWAWLLGRKSVAISVTIFVAVAAAIALARRELIATDRQGAWRFLLSLVICIPVTFTLFCLLFPAFEGPARYLATFSIPILICAAAAWNTNGPSWLKWGFRILLVLVLGIQSLAALVDAGDRHHDAVQWVTENHTDDAPVIISGAVNRIGFRHYGFPHQERILDIDGTTPETVAAEIEAALSHSGRVLFVRYHSHQPLLEAIDLLKQRAVIRKERSWKVNRELKFGALISDSSQEPWLANLPEPSLTWGTSSSLPAR